MEVAVLSSSADGTTLLWDMLARTPLATYKDNVPCLRGMVEVGAPITPSSAGPSRIDYILSTQSGRPGINIFTWSKDTPVFKCATAEQITCVATSSGSNSGSSSSSATSTYAVGGSPSGKLYIWDIATGELIRSWRAHFKSITCVAISSCGLYVASGGQDCALHVWDVCEVIDVFAAGNHGAGGGGGGGGGSAISGSNMASSIMGGGAGSSGGGNHDGSSSSGGGGAVPPVPLVTWTGHAMPLTQVSFTRSYGGGGQGHRVLSASLDQTVKLWDIPSHSCLFTLHAPAAITCIATSPPDGERASTLVIYAGCVDGIIYAADLATAAATAAASSSTNKTLSANFVGAANTSASSSSSSGGSNRGGFSSSSGVGGGMAFLGHTSTVTTISSTPDGLYLISGSDDGSVRVWDIESKQAISICDAHKSSPILSVLVLHPKPPHLNFTGKHGLLPLCPLAPLRKHALTVPLDWRGSTTGPTGRERTFVTRSYMQLTTGGGGGSGGAGDSSNSSSYLGGNEIDLIFRESISILRAVDDITNINNNSNTAANEIVAATAGKAKVTKDNEVEEKEGEEKEAEENREEEEDTSSSNKTKKLKVNNNSNTQQNDESQQIADLRAKVAALENENARWKDVNGKLVAKLQGTGKLPAAK